MATEFILIENGAISKIQAEWRPWRNVLGKKPDVLPDGWFEVDATPPAYNQHIERLIGPTRSIVDGQPVVSYAVEPFSEDETIASREAHWMRMNAEVEAYIYQHYNAGTQASFLALSIRSEQIKVALEPVWTWVGAVMGYYYGLKAEILSSEKWWEITWDFSQFDASDPRIELSGFMAG